MRFGGVETRLPYLECSPPLSPPKPALRVSPLHPEKAAFAEKSKTGDTSSHMGLPTNTTSCVDCSGTPSSRMASLIAPAHSWRAGVGLDSMSSGWHLHRSCERNPYTGIGM